MYFFCPTSDASNLIDFVVFFLDRVIGESLSVLSDTLILHVMDDCCQQLILANMIEY